MDREFNDIHDFAAEVAGIETPDVEPKIILPGGGIRIRDTARAVYTEGKKGQKLFYRGGNVTKAESLPGEEAIFFKPLKAAEARSEFEKYGRFVTFDKKKQLMDALMSEDIARAILASDVAQEILPNVNGLINTALPILEDGQLHMLQPGYDPRTRLYVTGQAMQEPATVEEAVRTLQSVLSDFEFTSEGDRSRAIAAILTPALKFGRFITGSIPIEIVEANESQTGKGFFTLRRAAVYGERPVLVTQQKGGVGSFDEKFASALIKARPFITFDNFRGVLDSPYVEGFLTSDGYYSVRTPGCPETYVDLSRFSISITSNGLQTTEDLANRASFIRMVKNDDADFVEIDGRRMLEHIRHVQPVFLGAVCKVIRHWHEQGMPKTAEKRHSFSGWARPLDWIVQNIFGMAPLLDGNTEAQDRIQSPHMTFLRKLVIEIEKKDKLNVPYSASYFLELCEEANIDVPGIKYGRSYDEKYERGMVGKTMAHFFRAGESYTMEGYRIDRDEEEVMTKQGNREMKKYYTVRRA
jgi:hypothetical protein